MKAKFIDYYNLASNLVLCTFIIGVANVFIRGLSDFEDLLIAGIILALRYFSVILIKRRFNFSKYLLIILIVRNIYKLFMIEATSVNETIALVLIIAQIVMTMIALGLITGLHQKLDLKKRY